MEERIRNQSKRRSTLRKVRIRSTKVSPRRSSKIKRKKKETKRVKNLLTK